MASGICLALATSFLGLTCAVLRKTLLAPEWLVAVLMSLQAGHLILSPAWAGASYFRRKVPFVSGGAFLAGGLFLLTAVSVPLVRWALGGTAGGLSVAGAAPEVLAFFLLAAAVYVASSGFNALLAGVYRCNYPVQFRARIISRITIWKVAATLMVTAGISRALDHYRDAYVWLFISGGIMFLLSGALYRRMPVAGEEHYPARLNWRQFKRHLLPDGVVSIMRENPHFRRFQLCQTLHGAGNLLCGPAYLLVMTDELRLSYFKIVLLGTVVPAVCQILSAMAWAPLVDRVSPAMGRVINSPFWILGLLVFALARPEALWPAYVAWVFTGLAMSGGNLLWMLGPLYYAPKEDASRYLAVHSFLTGARGLLFTLLGGSIYLYLGRWVFVIGAGMMAVAGILFYRQHRAEQRDPHFRGEPAAARALHDEVDGERRIEPSSGA